MTYCGSISCVVLLWYHTTQPNHTVTPTHIVPEQYNTWNKSTISRKLLKMAVLTFETCWAVNSEIINKWHQVDLSSFNLKELILKQPFFQTTRWLRMFWKKYSRVSVKIFLPSVLRVCTILLNNMVEEVEEPAMVLWSVKDRGRTDRQSACLEEDTPKPLDSGAPWV